MGSSGVKRLVFQQLNSEVPVGFSNSYYNPWFKIQTKAMFQCAILYRITKNVVLPEFLNFVSDLSFSLSNQ